MAVPILALSGCRCAGFCLDGETARAMHAGLVGHCMPVACASVPAGAVG